MAVRSCGFYVVALMKVRLDRPLPRVLRILEGAGARVEYIDEEQRRIAADLPASKLGSLQLLNDEYTEYLTVTVKASCRGEPPVVARILRETGFTKVPGSAGRTLYVGRWGGRVFEVEILKGRVRVKAGARTSGRPRPPLPPSVFALSLPEAASALEELRRFVSDLAGGEVR